MNKSTFNQSLLLIGASFIVLTFLIEGFGPSSWIQALSNEDELGENLQAIFCFMSSILFFMKYRQDKVGCDFSIFKTQKNIFFLLISISLFIVAGEEISWGQRIFHFETPEALLANNAQQEVNIHNLAIFQEEHSGSKVDELLATCCVLFFFAVPVLKRLHGGAALFIKRINFPLSPISLGFLLYLIPKKIQLLRFIHHSSKNLFYWEWKELDLYFIMMLIAVWFLFGKKKGGQDKLSILNVHHFNAGKDGLNQDRSA